MPNVVSRAYWSCYLAWHLVGQPRYPFHPGQRIASDRDRNVRRMVAYAYRWVPYYRETLDRLGLTPADLCSFDDLRKLPLISVADLQADADRFRSRQFRPEELLALSSSGSTGSPHVVWHSLASLYQNIGHAEREKVIFRRILGPGYRTLSINSATGSGGKVRGATRLQALWPRQIDAGKQTIAEGASFQEMRSAMNRVRPDVLTGYGTTLGSLFIWLERTGEPYHRPRLLRYAADALPAGVRAMLAERYGMACFSGYQAIDALKIGFECEQHRGYHINEDLYPVRIIDADGRDLPAGEPGEVVVSKLVNRATVLLNYRLADVATRIDGPCPCGRHLPLIGYVEGRTVDELYDTTGQRHWYGAAAAPVRQVAGLYQYQVTQLAHDRIRVDPVVSDACNREREAQLLTTKLQQNLGRDMQVEVRFVDQVERTPSGKVRYVRSLVDREGF